MLQQLRERLTIRHNLCKNCGSQPRDRDLTLPPDLAAICTVDTAHYCSVRCVEEANSRAAW